MMMATTRYTKVKTDANAKGKSIKDARERIKRFWGEKYECEALCNVVADVAYY